jgi:hypothetical protein
MFNDTIELLLACSSPVASPARGERVRKLLGQRIDWNLLLEQAKWHCVSPLVYSVLRTEADSVPAAALSTFRCRYELNFRHNLFLSGQMMQLVEKFRESNIPAIPYKGPVLCSYYGELGLREFGDLDFLVLSSDVPRANGMLHREGFRPLLYKACGQEPRTLPFAQAFHYEMAYATVDLSTKVDLHWALMPGFWALPDQVEEVWDRLRVRPVAGSSVTTLSHEDTLLLLCAHGAKHMWRSLGWICDVVSLLHSIPELDWIAIFDRAERFRVKRALRLGLELANSLLSATLPADVLRTIKDDKETEKLAATVRKDLFNADRKSENVLETCAFLMRTRENAKDAIRCAVERIFQPTMAEWESIALPRILFPAYYFLRPMRLLTKHGFRN